MKKKQLYRLNPQNLLVHSRHSSSPMHLHYKWEVLLFVDGKGVHTINDTVFNDVRQGDVFIIGPPHQHDLAVTLPHLHWDIYCDNDTMEKICNDIQPDLYEHLCNSAIRFTLRHDQLTCVLKDVELISKLHIPLPPDEEDHSPLRAFTNAIIAYLLNVYTLQDIQKKMDIPAWLLDFVNELKKPSVFSKRAHEVATLSHYSYPQLARIFKKYFGISLIDFLTDLRLNYAETLLLNTDYSVLAIANELGYANHALLTKKFKEKFGYTPMQHRRLHETKRK